MTAPNAKPRAILIATAKNVIHITGLLRWRGLRAREVWRMERAKPPPVPQFFRVK